MDCMNTTRLSLVAAGAVAVAFSLSSLRAQDATPPKGPSIEARVAKMKEKLSLTDDQVKSITAIFQDQKAKVDAIRADTSLTKEQKREKVKPILEDTKSKVDAVLTPEQKAKADQIRKEHAAKKKDAQPQQ